ncbi:MAG: glutathione S-transferase [Halieaceae bacterium]
MKAIIFWGLTASPFQLKMQALADAAGFSWQRWPDQAGVFAAISTYLKLSVARRASAIERFPKRDAHLDEYPGVPFYSLDNSRFFYDSSGLAHHLDQLVESTQPLVPREPHLNFICKLIDEAFDEFGLYMVHHNRWAVSAATNRMGQITSHEMRKLLPPGFRQFVARKLARRQVRRCPYLFSVAAPDFDAGVADHLTPPAREGFPPTHDILNDAWRRYLAAMEQVLKQQPFLLGHRFTLADASAYGQLSMNLEDGRAAELLAELAPLTHRWLCMIRDGAHTAYTGELSLSESLQPLLKIISDTLVPLMQQNEAAYCAALKRGQTLFNEAAFDKGEALYDGSLLDMPFRAVVKTFQIPVWRDVCGTWAELGENDRVQLQLMFSSLTDSEFIR